MMTRALLLVASAALLSACGADAPKCSPVTETVASTQGDTVTLTTGLRYIETNVGAGAAADWCQAISINYDAFLTDGTLWDASADAGQPYSFQTGFDQVLIHGLEQGSVGMKVGGTRHLIVPPGLGFGNNLIRFGTRKVLIPPNSTLVFDVTLVAVTPK